MTPGVEIPDLVRVQAVKPDAVTLEFTGAYELGFSKEIARQEFDVMGYSLRHVRGDTPEMDAAPEAGAMPDVESPNLNAPGAQSDPSQNHNMLAKTTWHVKAFMPGSPGGTQPGGQCAAVRRPATAGRLLRRL
jgi:hypothetical protein